MDGTVIGPVVGSAFGAIVFGLLLILIRKKDRSIVRLWFGIVFVFIGVVVALSALLGLTGVMAACAWFLNLVAAVLYGGGDIATTLAKYCTLLSK